MKRIKAIVKGVSEEVKARFQVKRIEKATDAALLNAQEDLETTEAELEELPTKVKEMSAENVVSVINELFEKKEDAEATIKRIKAIKEYLNSEVAETEEK